MKDTNGFARNCTIMHLGHCSTESTEGNISNVVLKNGLGNPLLSPSLFYFSARLSWRNTHTMGWHTVGQNKGTFSYMEDVNDPTWDICHNSLLPFLLLQATKTLKLDKSSNLFCIGRDEKLPFWDIESLMWPVELWRELAGVLRVGEGASNSKLFHASDPICLCTANCIPH